MANGSSQAVPSFQKQTAKGDLKPMPPSPCKRPLRPWNTIEFLKKMSGNAKAKFIPRIEFIEHLRRYRCILKEGGRHGDIYFRRSISQRQFIPRCKEISAKLAIRICDALELIYPDPLRQEHSPNFSQSFDEAVQSLTDQGYPFIKKVRYHMHTYHPPKKHKLKSETSPSAVSFEYEALDKDDLEEGEFWIPVGYDGFRTWEQEACAPPWITHKPTRTRWVKKFWRESQWPDHGEKADDPTRFIQSELGILQCDLKGSSDVPKKHRKHFPAVVSVHFAYIYMSGDWKKPA
jgi:hypothetical protein